jgi:ABC-type transport system involved in Fe-S cluster assembly fused permease/ATPase subunit
MKVTKDFIANENDDKDVKTIEVKDTKTLNLPKTAIFIAHRLKTISDSDHIFVLDKGRIVEEGDHDSLVQKGGIYSDMWISQSKHS